VGYWEWIWARAPTTAGAVHQLGRRVSAWVPQTNEELMIARHVTGAGVVVGARGRRPAAGF
jgi:hypothetical protein